MFREEPRPLFGLLAKLLMALVFRNVPDRAHEAERAAGIVEVGPARGADPDGRAVGGRGRRAVLGVEQSTAGRIKRLLYDLVYALAIFLVQRVEKGIVAGCDLGRQPE